MSDVTPPEETDVAPASTSATAAVMTAPLLDLDGIEGDLADVELALARLDTGEYWRDEVTGRELDDVVLAARPTARRNVA